MYLVFDFSLLKEYFLFQQAPQGWSLTYFETCTIWQMRVIFTYSEMKIHLLNFFLSVTDWQEFIFLQLF